MDEYDKNGVKRVLSSNGSLIEESQMIMLEWVGAA